MHKRLGHKPLALVTGASSGIGLEFARLLSEAGCELVLVSNDAEKLQAAADELQANSICMDLSERDSAEKLFDWCNGLGLKVDLLVNNAGMFFWDKMNEERLEDAEELLRLNGLTPMKLCVLFGEQMKSRGCGYIINVASSAAQLPFPGLGCYSGSKALLKNYSKSLHYEYRPFGVRVTALCPAAVATDLYGLRKDLLEFGTRIGFIQKPRRTALKALKAVRRGRKVCYPAFMCYYLPVLLWLLPSCVIDLIWRKTRGGD